MPTPSGEESEGKKPLNVITWVWKCSNLEINKETQIENSLRNSWKAKRQRRKIAQKLQEKNAKLHKNIVKKQDEEKQKEGSIVARQV